MTYCHKKQWFSDLGAGLPIRGSKRRGESDVDSVFHPSEVPKMSANNSWMPEG